MPTAPALFFTWTLPMRPWYVAYLLKTAALPGAQFLRGYAQSLRSPGSIPGVVPAGSTLSSLGSMLNPNLNMRKMIPMAQQFSKTLAGAAPTAEDFSNFTQHLKNQASMMPRGGPPGWTPTAQLKPRAPTPAPSPQHVPLAAWPSQFSLVGGGGTTAPMPADIAGLMQRARG